MALRSSSSAGERPPAGERPARGSRGSRAGERPTRASHASRASPSRGEAWGAPAAASSPRAPACAPRASRGAPPASGTPLPCRGRPTCIICYEAPADTVFLECGHAGVCADCARTITQGARDPDTGATARGTGSCPICRAPILQVLRIGPDAMAAANEAGGRGVLVAQVLAPCYWR